MSLSPVLLLLALNLVFIAAALVQALLNTMVRSSSSGGGTDAQDGRALAFRCSEFRRRVKVR